MAGKSWMEFKIAHRWVHDLEERNCEIFRVCRSRWSQIWVGKSGKMLCIIGEQVDDDDDDGGGTDVDVVVFSVEICGKYFEFSFNPRIEEMGNQQFESFLA